MTKRVLFLVNGLGLGNSTRCHAIISHLLALNCRVQIITSDNGIWYFRDIDAIEKIHEIRSLYYGKRDGRISIPSTLSAIPDFIDIMKSNNLVLDTVLEDFSPDAVVADSVYSSKSIKRLGIPLININNADVVVASKRCQIRIPRSVRAQYHFVEYFDYLYHRHVPDIVLSPSLEPETPLLHDKIRRIGPIVRQGLVSLDKNNPRRAIIMLSGSTFGTQVVLKHTRYEVPVDVVGREAPLNHTNTNDVNYLGRLIDSRPIVNKSSLAIVNGGFSAVSEMFYRRCPVVVMPVPGHAEQWVNANTIERLGVGVSASEEKLEEKLIELIERADEYSAAYERLPLPKDGAHQAAQIILANS